MSDYPNLRKLIIFAGVDSDFRKGLLNGNRRQVIASFGLSDYEREVVLAIKAETLSDFARALLNQVAQQPSVA